MVIGPSGSKPVFLVVGCIAHQFATQDSRKVLRFWSCLPHPQVEKQAALSISWDIGLLCLYCPVSVVSLHKILREEAKAIKILPHWLHCGQIPMILGMLVDCLTQLPHHPMLLLDPHGYPLRSPDPQVNHMEGLWSHLEAADISTQAARTVDAALHPQSCALYLKTWNAFFHWCGGRYISHFHPPVNAVIDYLQG